MDGVALDRVAFERELRAKMAERAREMLATEAAVLARLEEARSRILALLAEQPEDWQRLPLQRLLAQLDEILQGSTERMASALRVGQARLWQLGEDAVDKPLTAAGLNLEAQLGALNADVLKALTVFAESRIRNVGAEALAAIRRQLDLTVLGVQTPFQAMKAVAAALGKDTGVNAKGAMRRAQTIVRTEQARVFATAQHARLTQAAAKSDRVGKRWMKSRKLHARWNHAWADGQVREVDEPYVLPSDHGVVKLLHPHDAQAPAGETINCGCVSVMHLFKPGDRRGPKAFAQPEGSGSLASLYDPSSPRELPDVGTPARRAAVAFEEQVRRERLEHGAFFDAKGGLIAEASGEADRVGFPADLAAKGATFTHNHPGGRSLSEADLLNAAHYGLFELRAVTPDFRYSMQAGEAGWPSRLQMLAVRSALEAAALRKVQELQGQRLLALAYGNWEYSHQLMRLYAERFGLRYSRTRS